MAPDITTVRALAEKVTNWGRWGDDDELGTLNHIEPADVAAAAALVQTGAVRSLALPYDETGPQTGGLGRFNPIHLMIRDGGDAMSGATVRDFYGGRDAYMRGADDIIIMPLQCGTQWDALSHVFFEDHMYNGYSADLVSSRGAQRNGIAKGVDRLVGRGILLDVARHRGADALDPGFAIDGDVLAACADAQGVEVRRGDIVLIRTGQLGAARSAEDWTLFTGASAPGLGLGSVDWISEHEVAAVATDTWGMEVLPNETADVYQPLHILLIAFMGLWVGEIFDLDGLAEDCAGDGRYEFFFVGPPLPFTRAVGSPLNPIVVR